MKPFLGSKKIVDFIFLLLFLLIYFYIFCSQINSNCAVLCQQMKLNTETPREQYHILWLYIYNFILRELLETRRRKFTKLNRIIDEIKVSRARDTKYSDHLQPADVSGNLVNKYVCSRSIKQYEVSLVILLFSAQQQCPFRGKEYKL